jgi:hypothetical protein
MQWTVSSTSNGMDNTQNNMANYSSDDNKKTILITVAAGIIVLGALVWWLRQTPFRQVGVNPTPDAEAAAINQDVNSVNVGNLNAEFQAIDTDLQEL